MGESTLKCDGVVNNWPLYLTDSCQNFWRFPSKFPSVLNCRKCLKGDARPQKLEITSAVAEALRSCGLGWQRVWRLCLMKPVLDTVDWLWLSSLVFQCCKITGHILAISYSETLLDHFHFQTPSTIGTRCLTWLRDKGCLFNPSLESRCYDAMPRPTNSILSNSGGTVFIPSKYSWKFHLSNLAVISGMIKLAHEKQRGYSIETHKVGWRLQTSRNPTANLPSSYWT